jgi:hypothetical protein
MPSDPIADLLQSKFGIDPSAKKCDQFRLGVVNAMFIKGEFNAVAQIDGIPGGPTEIQGATLYAGAASDDGNRMFCSATVGPPMDNQKVMNFGLPISLSTSTDELELKGTTNVVVAVVIAYGSSEKNMKTCFLTATIPVSPST